MSFIAILLTLFVGLFILIGSICGIYTKNNKKLTDFSISIAFGVLIGLSILEILPEAFGILNEQLGVFRGICSLIVLILIIITAQIASASGSININRYNYTKNIRYICTIPRT